jgi:predicted metal-dependent hydrolase
MTEVFTLEDIFIEVEFRKVKTMRITVYPPDGRVLITAPPKTPAGLVGKFAASKLSWIKKHREKFLSRSKTSAPLKNSGIVMLWGEELSIETIEKPGYSKITLKDTVLKMQFRPGMPQEKQQEILDRWRRKILKEAALPLVDKWEKAIGVKVEEISIRKMRSIWGSCNKKKRLIRLNSELTKKSPECLEYVVVHEMIHIIESGHNQKFYRLLGKFIPDWKTIRKKMNTA